MERATTYLLKVWQTASGGFRAHLRAVDQEAALGFDSVEALANHLAAAAPPLRPLPGTHLTGTQPATANGDGPRR